MTDQATALIVEDDASSADFLETVLLDVPGLDVIIVQSAAAARRALLSERQFALIITDVNLPGEDGLSLVASVRGMPARKATPVVVITSDDDESLERRAAGMGVRAFFTKPYSPGRLRDIVHSILNGT
jgi:two-component system chemotaxis response regulator CheY